jgi:hypothetical protein
MDTNLWRPSILRASARIDASCSVHAASRPVDEDEHVSPQSDFDVPHTPPERSPQDFTTMEFVAVLRGLEPHLPISDAFERDLRQLQGTWWSSQREHMIGWFGAQHTLGTGKYRRATPNTSARRTYGRLLSTAALVWMAEALGEDLAVVRAAADAARAEPDARKRPAVVRRLVPWERIAQLVHEARRSQLGSRPRRWRRDP